MGDASQLEAKCSKNNAQLSSIHTPNKILLKFHADKISPYCEDCADIILTNAQQKNFDDLLYPYLKAATLIKHRGFMEEREVRIVVCPMTENQVDKAADAAKKSFSEFKSAHPAASFKPICVSQKTKGRRYVVLFEGSASKLPIRRVIVGPSLTQRDNFARVAELLERRQIAVTCSETPFVGQQA
jgi:hypothetical protein